MMAPRQSCGGRHGLSLMEVLVALTIFLLAFVALGRLVILGSDQAFDAQQQVRAADLCQSKMAEIIAGAVPLTTESDVAFQEDPVWHWSLDCEKSNYRGLWNVTVRVSRQDQQGMHVCCTVSQMVLDPQTHGNLQDTPPGTTTDSDSSSRDRSSRSGGTSSSTGGGN
jgi:general secretion pathway protein I